MEHLITYLNCANIQNCEANAMAIYSATDMWLLILICLFLLLCFKVSRLYIYWWKRGVCTVNPSYWFHVYNENITRTTSSAVILKNLYEKHKDKRYIGLYQFFHPVLLVFDPELIKTICIRDFNSFSDHNEFLPKYMDTLWSRNLFTMGSKDGWHDIRGIITSFFTTSKMRTMFPLMQECANQFLTFLKTNRKEGVVDMKQACSRYAHDVIARTGFGVSIDSLNNKNDEFYSMVKEANDFSAFKGLKFLLCFFLPFLAKLLNMKFYNESVATFFKAFVTETLQYRTNNKVVRPDIIHLLTEARKTSSKLGNKLVDVKKTFVKNHNLELTDEDITSNMLLLLFAGVESISTVMSHVCYELAKNSDIQEKLCDEVKQILSHSNGEVTYEVLNSMKYLDNVISETLRLYPPASLIDRKCVKPYIIDDEKSVLLDESLWVWIPVGAIHRDKNYFPNPDKFDPDRFNEENKQNIIPFTYFPFGVGPRNCVGSKMALLECKLLLVEILTKYELVIPASPMNYISREEMTKHPENVWIGLKPKM